jgi:hypothetical protein
MKRREFIVLIGRAKRWWIGVALRKEGRFTGGHGSDRGLGFNFLPSDVTRSPLGPRIIDRGRQQLDAMPRKPCISLN